MTRMERLRTANRGPAPTPALPTGCKPGTIGKLAAMGARVEAGEGLFHPLDARHDGTCAAAFASRKGAYAGRSTSDPRVFAVMLAGEFSEGAE